jgi:hypothetical protein
VRSSMATHATGLRRVEWIRLLVDRDEVSAEAIGVGFRLPATCPISLEVANRLIGSGTPYVTHRVERGARV